MENLELFKTRALYSNNDRQHNRMVRDKLRTMHRALLYSYQAGIIRIDKEEEKYVRALINPDRIKFDYDEKIISVDFESGLTPGESYEWPKDSGIHWLIYKQELTELAYFRGNARRCQLIEVKDPQTGEKFSVWCAVRGPVETKINTIYKKGIIVDVPNLSLNVYVKRTEQTIRSFDRYRKFYFMGKWWMVEAPDWISTPGILEFTAVENYECNGDELIIKKKDPNPEIKLEEPHIEGNTFTKPLIKETFKIVPSSDKRYQWSIRLSAEKNKEIDDVVDYTIDYKDNTMTVKWTAMTSGSYIISYGPYEKIVAVESLF